MNAGLLVENLDAWYGRARVLYGVSLTAAPGEAVALLGRNGAGKSTTFRAIVGLLKTRSGAVRFAGSDLMKIQTHEIARLGLGYVPEDRRIFADLTVKENLSVGRRPPRGGAPVWSEDKLFALFPNLAALAHRPAGRMSGGEQQMLAIARTLMGNPSALLLDEPSESLAPRIVEELIGAIAEMKRQGLGLVVAEQNLAFARLVASRVCVIEKGVVRFSGSMAEFDAAPEVRDAYLAL